MFLAQASTGYDLSPLINGAITFGVTVLSMMTLWVTWYVKSLMAQRLEINAAKLNDQRQETFDYAAARSLAHAEQSVGGVVPKTAGTDHPFIMDAADYLEKGWPDLIKKLEITPAHLKEMLLARASKGEMTEKADAITAAKAGPATAPPAAA